MDLYVIKIAVVAVVEVMLDRIRARAEGTVKKTPLCTQWPRQGGDGFRK